MSYLEPPIVLACSETEYPVVYKLNVLCEAGRRDNGQSNIYRRNRQAHSSNRSDRRVLVDLRDCKTGWTFPNALLETAATAQGLQ
jgi:hypothetical protein